MTLHWSKDAGREKRRMTGNTSSLLCATCVSLLLRSIVCTCSLAGRAECSNVGNAKGLHLNIVETHKFSLFAESWFQNG